MTDPVIYPYRDSRGQLLYRVVRHTPKRFELFDAAGRRLDEFPDRTVLYRLPELLRADKTSLVFVTEGEKDADRLAALGLVATTNPGGCRLGWKDEYTTALVGRHVIILADNDKPGARHAERIEVALLGKAASVAVLKLPRLRRAEDVSDWLDFRQGTRDELLQRVEQMLRPKPRRLASPLVKGDAKRDTIFNSRILTATERLLLLAMQHYGGRSDRSLTAADLAVATGLHRVSVQRLITRLTKRSLMIRRDGRLEVRWEHVL